FLYLLHIHAPTRMGSAEDAADAPGQRPAWLREGSRIRGGAMQDQKLPVLEKIGFGAGDMAVNVVISSMMLIITFFYTDVFGLRPTDVALLLIVVRMFDAVTDPLMGLVT